MSEPDIRFTLANERTFPAPGPYGDRAGRRRGRALPPGRRVGGVDNPRAAAPRGGGAGRLRGLLPLPPRGPGDPHR
ncbi:hypothetical protein LP418_05425 [Nocardioides sp. B-3]|nr:hypothetical protein [Nocardioides sp. B-3]UUZ60350.1 hypothetical protein LP418_05425 [Nocardioides sp. B-3]